jgi:molybdopterin converting factor small subunit
MGSMFGFSRLTMEVGAPSCTIAHNTVSFSQAKTRFIGEKKYQNPDMQVKVHYISLVKSYTNTSQDEFTLPNGTVLAELLDKIAQDYGKPFTQEVYDPIKKEMKTSFVAMVNGTHMDQLQGINTPLKDRDSVILMSLMTGG